MSPGRPGSGLPPPGARGTADPGSTTCAGVSEEARRPTLPKEAPCPARPKSTVTSPHWTSPRICGCRIQARVMKSCGEESRGAATDARCGGQPPDSRSQVHLEIKNLPDNVGDIRDPGSMPGSRRSPGGGHGNPLQYSCLENPMDRGAWWATVHGVTKRWTGLSD